MGVGIISDCHDRIIEAIRKERNGFTGDMGIRHFCLLHIHGNFSSTHPGGTFEDVMLVGWKYISSKEI